jgi:hypothetical protein
MSKFGQVSDVRPIPRGPQGGERREEPQPREAHLGSKLKRQDEVASQSQAPRLYDKTITVDGIVPTDTYRPAEMSSPSPRSHAVQDLNMASNPEPEHQHIQNWVSWCNGPSHVTPFCASQATINSYVTAKTTISTSSVNSVRESMRYV